MFRRLAARKRRSAAPINGIPSVIRDAKIPPAGRIRGCYPRVPLDESSPVVHPRPPRTPGNTLEIRARVEGVRRERVHPLSGAPSARNSVLPRVPRREEPKGGFPISRVRTFHPTQSVFLLAIFRPPVLARAEAAQRAETWRGQRPRRRRRRR